MYSNYWFNSTKILVITFQLFSRSKFWGTMIFIKYLYNLHFYIKIKNKKKLNEYPKKIKDLQNNINLKVKQSKKVTQWYQYQTPLNISFSILSIICGCSIPSFRNKFWIALGLTERSDGKSNNSFPKRAGLCGWAVRTYSPSMLCA